MDVGRFKAAGVENLYFIEDIMDRFISSGRNFGISDTLRKNSCYIIVKIR